MKFLYPWHQAYRATRDMPVMRKVGCGAESVRPTNGDVKNLLMMRFEYRNVLSKDSNMGLLGMIPPHGIGLFDRIQLLGRSGFRVVSSPAWVFNNDNGSASNCASNCANNCGNNVQNNSDFRRTVFAGSGSFWKKVLLTCGTSAKTLLTMIYNHLFLCLLNIRRGQITCLNMNNILTNTKRRGHLDW